MAGLAGITPKRFCLTQRAENLVCRVRDNVAEAERHGEVTCMRRSNVVHRIDGSSPLVDLLMRVANVDQL